MSLLLDASMLHFMVDTSTKSIAAPESHTDPLAASGTYEILWKKPFPGISGEHGHPSQLLSGEW
jgi:hypothetical protein